MRKLLFKFAIFLGSILFFMITVGQHDNRHPLTDSNIIRLKVSGQFDGLDYLFLGSSYTYSGVVPQLFEKIDAKAYNLGIATASAHFYELLISDYMNSVSQKPKVVVLECSPMSFSSQSDNWISYPIHRYLSDPVSNEEILWRFNINKHYLLLIRKSFIKASENLRHYPFFSPSMDSRKYDEILRSKGYEKTEQIFSEKIYKENEKYYVGLRKDKIDERKVAMFISLIKKLQANGIEAVVVEMPTLRLKGFFSQAYLKDYDDFFSTLQAQGVHFIRLAMPSQEDYFRDIDHLNYKGATLFTQMLIEKLPQPELSF